MKYSSTTPLTVNKKTNVYFIIVLTFFIAAVFPTRSIAETVQKKGPIRLASIRQENSYDGRTLNLIYTEAFKRLGYELEYVFFPPKRASMMAETGKVDGEFARAYQYNEKLPHLIRVEEPVISIKFSAFTTNPEIKLNGWDSLKGTDYTVDYMMGLKLCEIKLHGIVNKKNLSQLSHWSQGLKKIISKRTDIYVEVERTVLRELKTGKFKNSNIRIAGVMEEINLYAFLNKKHASLVPQLASILKKMKDEGTIKDYIDSVDNTKD